MAQKEVSIVTIPSIAPDARSEMKSIQKASAGFRYNDFGLPDMFDLYKTSQVADESIEKVRLNEVCSRGEYKQNNGKHISAD